MRKLVVTAPAADKDLLSITELREAAGVTDSSRDAELRNLGLRIASSIASECNIAIGADYEPTLRQETLTETIYSLHCGSSIFLSRRHNVLVTSITVDDVLIAAADYFVDAEAGCITMITSGYPSVWSWYGQTVVVVYLAGFATVPNDLKQAAMDFFRSTLAEAGRDPFVKSLTRDVPGVGSKSVEYWVGSVPGQTGEGAVPLVVSGQLKRFRNTVLG